MRFIRRPGRGETGADVAEGESRTYPLMFGAAADGQLPTQADAAAARSVLSLGVYVSAIAGGIRDAGEQEQRTALRFAPEDLVALYGASFTRNHGFEGRSACMALSLSIPLTPRYAEWLMRGDSLRRATERTAAGAPRDVDGSKWEFRLWVAGADTDAPSLEAAICEPAASPEDADDEARLWLSAAFAVAASDALANAHMDGMRFRMVDGVMRWKPGSSLAALWFHALVGEDTDSEPAVCLCCGHPFIRRRGTAGRQRKYCGDSCSRFSENRTRVIPKGQQRRAFIEGGGLREAYRKLHG